MSAIVEWETAFTIRSAYGDLDLNDDSSGDTLYLLIESGCSATRSLRVVSDEIPQGDGQIHHRRFTDGYEIRLLIALMETREAVACDERLRDMTETLMLHVNNMINDPGRILWTPTGLGDDRMLDQARVFETAPPSRGELGAVQFAIGWDSPFPYVIDASEQSVSFIDGIDQDVVNDGTVPVFPVWRIAGSASPTSFQILNTFTGEQLVYDESLPGAVTIGAGDYGEFDFFRNTAYLNGTGANLKAGINLELSDFWAIDPGGAVNVEVDGADGTLLFNNALA